MKKIWPFLFRLIMVMGLTFSPAPHTSSAAGIETGSYHEDFSSYDHLDYGDQAEWDIFNGSLHLQNSNGVLANYGYEHTAAAWDASVCVTSSDASSKKSALDECRLIKPIVLPWSTIGTITEDRTPS